MLKPLASDILFVFLDEVENDRFVEKVGSIYLGKIQELTVKSPRWGKVVAVGPDVKEDIKSGTNILIEPLAWTRGLEYDGHKIWKTCESRVLGVEEI